MQDLQSELSVVKAERARLQALVPSELADEGEAAHRLQEVLPLQEQRLISQVISYLKLMSVCVFVSVFVCVCLCVPVCACSLPGLHM